MQAVHDGDKRCLAGGFAERWLDKWAWQWQTTGEEEKGGNNKKKKGGGLPERVHGP